MMTVTRWRLVHSLGMELLEASDPTSQIQHGLASMLRIVPGDVAGEVEGPPGRIPRVAESPDLLKPTLHGDVPELFRTNPAVIHLVRHHHLTASRVEDLCSPEEWARNPMRLQLLEPNRVPHALLAGTFEDGVVHGFGVNRGRPFSDDEVDLLESFAGFMRRAASDRRRQELVIDLEQAVSAGAGLVLARGPEVIHVNEEAAELLERHQVPMATLLHVSRGVLRQSNPVAALPTALGVLRLRWRPALPGSLAVVLDEPSGDSLGERPQLTNRQWAMLCHLSQGLTAGAIARQVGISERTVNKHLENLYRALSVRDRLGAVTRGRALGLLPVVGGCGRLDGTVAVAG